MHPEETSRRCTTPPGTLRSLKGCKMYTEVGSLVQIEEPVDKELKALKEQAKQQRFDPESGEVVESKLPSLETAGDEATQSSLPR